MDVKEIFERLYEVKGNIERAIAQNERGKPVMIDPYEVGLNDPEDPDELARHDALIGILDHLDKVLYELEYWDSEPLEGVLQRKANGRYDLNGFELTSGMIVEILTAPFDGDPLRWTRTKVEHDGEDYYLVAGHQRLDGLTARIR